MKKVDIEKIFNKLSLQIRSTGHNYGWLTVSEGKEVNKVSTLKQEALAAIEQLSETAYIDAIMYKLYVIDKVRKGREAVVKGETISAEDLNREIESW